MFFYSLRKHFNLQLGLACCLVAFSQFNYGFDGAAFDSTQAMNAFDKQFGAYNAKTKAYAIPTNLLSQFNALQYVGFACGLVLGTLVSQRFGRRVTLAAMSLYVFMSATIVITSATRGQILAGRIIHYGYIGMELSVVPVFMSEIVPASVRGLVVGTYQLSLVLGRIVMGAVCYKTAQLKTSAAYRIPFGLFYIVPTIVLAGIFFIPESPRWLLTKDRFDDARKNHYRYRQGTMTDEDIEAEFQVMLTAIRAEPEQGKTLELFKGVNLKRTMIVVGMAMFQQITGQTFATTYGAVYIKSLGTINPFAMTTGNSCISAFAIICCLLFVDKIGRRRFLMLGALIQTVALITMGCLGLQSPVTLGHKSGIVACLSVFVFGFGNSWGPLTFVVITELPALRLRDASQRIGALTNIVFQFAMNYSIPYLLNAPYADLGSKVGFIFGSFSFLAFCFVYFFVPELAGKSLDEIDMMFHKGIALRSFEKQPHMDVEAEAEGIDGYGDDQNIKTTAIHVEAKEARATSPA